MVVRTDMFYMPCNVQWITPVCRRLRLGLDLPVATDCYRPIPLKNSDCPKRSNIDG